MAGLKDLEKLTGDMSPELHPGEYVFCITPVPVALDPSEIIGSFREKEGLTLIVNRATADRLGFQYDFTASWITLGVHSSLAAVGLTALVSKALADKGIACNVVAGFYHDHLFVPKREEIKAMTILERLSRGSEN